MRFVSSMFERVAGQFVGDDNRSNGRVTVEPTWQLNTTPPIYAGSVRGPYRYFVDTTNPGVEWEVPNIKSISWDRSEDQDIATCTITLYNMWHEGNMELPELEGQLGKPGYLWPKRGLEVNRWNQLGGRGAYSKTGIWDGNFSWQNVLVPFGLIRTYEGYGGNPTPGNFVSVQANLNNENVLQTGTWLIDNISAGSEGEMVLNCKDVGTLLLKQLCFPPTIPPAVYPVDYYPAGKSPFDSFFGTKPKTGVSPASFGEVHKNYYTSSLDIVAGAANASVDGHYGSHACDGNWNTYALSEAYATPDQGTPFWDFVINDGVTKVALKPWAGGYDCYLSIYTGGIWLGSELVPGASHKYVAKVSAGLALPDGMEPETYIEIPSQFFDPGKRYTSVAIARITLTNSLYYSGISTGGNYYRAGIRDVNFLKEGAKVSPYSPDFATLPWTYSMTSHPTRGYWVLDSNGTVHGFGDAADFDSSSPSVGQVPLTVGKNPNNLAIAMDSHPDGKGFWVIDIQGRVYAYGSAAHYGEVVVPWPGTDKWGEDGMQAWDIACTPSGNGYWVIYGNGVVHGFGDASPNYVVLPWTNVGIYMNANVNPRYLFQRNGNGICGHPTQMGFWATTGSGEVYAYGACRHMGQLQDRVYNPGMADSFRLGSLEYTKSIETTVSGNGYWIAFGSGRIAAFGDAVNQGKTYIYDNVPNFDIDLRTIQEAEMWGFFRALVWSIARDPDGSGFWVLIANGNVGHYNAEFWGSPGYQGKTGFRWHEGNYNGDPMSIVREMLAWSGWTFYSPSASTLDIFGETETTGIAMDTQIGAEKFDKRPILDIIKELCEVVGYKFAIREDGGVRITSPNIWRSGNRDWDGEIIYVDGSSFTRVPESDPNSTEFIPLIDENIDLFSYQTSLSGDSMRSEVIIGTDMPDSRNPRSTGFIRHTPQSSVEQLKPGVPALRNIPIPAMWINQVFTNPEEVKLMAELIDLNAWFSMRTGTATCVANPCYSPGDQVKFAERNTSEYNIHYIRGINSSHEIDTGVWEYTLNTHWLGDKDNWVITSNNALAPVVGQHYFQISETVDRWQQKVGLGLGKGGQASGWSELSNIVSVSGEFDRSSMGVEVQPEQDMHWRLNGTITMYRPFNGLTFTVDNRTAPLGSTCFLDIRDSSNNLIYSGELSSANVAYPLPVLGSLSGRTDYTYSIYGYPATVGTGRLSFTLKDYGLFKALVDDTILIVG